MQRLSESGVIQIVAVTDPVQVGFTRQAMVGVRTEGDVEEVADRLAGIKEVDYLVVTAGSFEILLEIVGEDQEERELKLGAWIGNQRSRASTLPPERVEQLGGTLRIDTAPGQGTTLTVDLSLAEFA